MYVIYLKIHHTAVKRPSGLKDKLCAKMPALLRVLKFIMRK